MVSRFAEKAGDVRSGIDFAGNGIDFHGNSVIPLTDGKCDGLCDTLCSDVDANSSLHGNVQEGEWLFFRHGGLHEGPKDDQQQYVQFMRQNHDVGILVSGSRQYLILACLMGC